MILIPSNDKLMTKNSPFRYFKTSAEVIRLVVIFMFVYRFLFVMWSCRTHAFSDIGGERAFII
jgi:hypothetical protein